MTAKMTNTEKTITIMKTQEIQATILIEATPVTALYECDADGCSNWADVKICPTGPGGLALPEFKLCMTCWKELSS